MNVNTSTVLVVGFAASVSISMAVLAQGPRRDGKWETTMQMEMEGMPVRMAPMTTTNCVTKEQADDPTKFTPQGRGGRGAEPPCKASDVKVDGNKVTWTMKCEGARPITAVGEMVFGDGTYTGTTKVDMNGRGTMTMQYTGKRVGDCEEK